MINALHSSESIEHYTPAEIIKASQEWLGEISLDPASCKIANERINAEYYFTKEDDGLSRSWAVKFPCKVFLNPPGGGLTPSFWRKLCEEFESENVSQAVYIGFSIEQLAVLQNSKAYFSPLDFPICVPSKRLKFIRKDGTIGNKPTHANVIVGLSRPDKWQSFKEIFSQFGDVKI